ncbi:MAG: PfkB family carbohydrate kinase [Candidatus Omnitrophica bacterium]|nr:PfkB family carbohydrate kinase [Candidatus Omnitrophota bacterium]
MSVLVVGTVALDTITTPLGRKEAILGGSAVFSALSASYFSPVNLVAVVGEDFPQDHISLLKKKKINLDGLDCVAGKTFCWTGVYGEDFSDPETLATELNVLVGFNPSLPESYRDSKYVFLANVDPDIQHKVLAQVKKPKLVVCDTMNFWIANKPESLLKLLKKVDVFLLNYSEARLLTRKNNLLDIGAQLMKMGPACVVIKKGEHGVVSFNSGKVFSLPACLINNLCDPTGAGDTFAGGFIGYLSSVAKWNELSFKKAIVHGSVMATFAVEDFSVTKLAAVNKALINRRVRELIKITKI